MEHQGLIILIIIVIVVILIWAFSDNNHEEKREKHTSLFPERPIIKLLTGEKVEFCNLDNAASTLPLSGVIDKIQEFAPYSAGIHRGSGFSSKLSTKTFDECREIIMDFVGAYSPKYTCIYGKNTTECINVLSAYSKGEKGKVIISKQEHHSNMIPWKRYNPMYVEIDRNGYLDLEDLENKLKNNHVFMVSLTGASNVTGIINPIKEISEIVHRYGAYLSIDGAQLVPHRKVNMEMDGIDFLSFSGHKMYAPFGLGVLVGLKSFFEGKEPFMLGGGEVEMVTMDKVYWKESPDKDEAGSQNVMGALALAESMLIMKDIGMENIEDYEENLVSYCITELGKIDKVDIIATSDSQKNIGIVTFQVRHLHYAQVAAILDYEYGIGCRAGCFCAAILVKELLGLSEGCVVRNIDVLTTKGDRRLMSGMVRFSLALSTKKKDIDRAVAAVKEISEGNSRLLYDQNLSGEYVPTAFADGTLLDVRGFEQREIEKHFTL